MDTVRLCQAHQAKRRAETLAAAVVRLLSEAARGVTTAKGDTFLRDGAGVKLASLMHSAEFNFTHGSADVEFTDGARGIWVLSFQSPTAEATCAALRRRYRGRASVAVLGTSKHLDAVAVVVDAKDWKLLLHPFMYMV
jgi:hypothetical protein